jgi:hypothetical protein
LTCGIALEATLTGLSINELGTPVTWSGQTFYGQAQLGISDSENPADRVSAYRAPHAAVQVNILALDPNTMGSDYGYTIDVSEGESSSASVWQGLLSWDGSSVLTVQLYVDNNGDDFAISIRDSENHIEHKEFKLSDFSGAVLFETSVNPWFGLQNIMTNTLATTLDSVIVTQSNFIVDDIEELKNVLTVIQPGDIVELESGIYNLTEDGIISCEGSDENPIVIQSLEPLGAEFIGSGGVYLDGVSNVVLRGFKFNLAKLSNQIELYNCQKCRITRCLFESDESLMTETDYQNSVVINGKYSHHNRIDHNLFQNKAYQGYFVYIGVEDSDDSNSQDNVVYGSQYDRIDHNYFRNWSYVGDIDPYNSATVMNGNNISANQKTSFHTIIEDNLFELYEATDRIITIKSSDNVIRRNTFINCYGHVSLRAGDRNIFANNFFFNTDDFLDMEDYDLIKGGVRCYGEDHFIYNNYFENLNGTDWSAPLALMHGDDPDLTGGADAVRAKNVIVANNTWVNCRELNIGIDSSIRPYPPEDCFFVNNIVYGNKDNNPLLSIYEADGVTFIRNIVYPTGTATTGIEGLGYGISEIRVIDPGLAYDGRLYRLAGLDSSAVGNASDLIFIPDMDFDGQARKSQSADIGADEFVEGSIRIAPLCPADVGPYAYMRADINRDEIVNMCDLEVLIEQWLQVPSGDFLADIAPESGDSWVNMRDFSVLSEQYLRSQ